MASSVVAPVALIGGWTLAAARQRPGYRPVHDTISALAARDASDRWIMTFGLAVLGICHVVTASGLTEARAAGRVLLALGGAATVAVAALPQPAAGHVPAAAAGFVALALWPVFSEAPSRVAGRAATVVLLVLLGWFGLQLNGELLGLTERFVAGAEALWPLAVVVSVLRRNARQSV